MNKKSAPNAKAIMDNAKVLKLKNNDEVPTVVIETDKK